MGEFKKTVQYGVREDVNNRLAICIKTVYILENITPCQLRMSIQNMWSIICFTTLTLEVKQKRNLY